MRELCFHSMVSFVSVTSLMAPGKLNGFFFSFKEGFATSEHRTREDLVQNIPQFPGVVKNQKHKFMQHKTCCYRAFVS